MHEHHHDGAVNHLPTFESPEMAAYAELEGEVLADLVAEATSILAEQSRLRGLDVRRVLDIGSGPGVGSCLLAQRFGEASVVAVDGSAAMLEHAVARAGRLGLGDRVDTRLAELPGGLSGLGPAEIVWASMMLHHVGDEVGALGEFRQLLAPGGMLALVEGRGPVRFLPDDVDLGRPGIWDRLDAAWEEWFDHMRSSLAGSITSADPPVILEQAGFELLADHSLAISVGPPLDEPSRRFASVSLARALQHLGPLADPADLQALEPLLDDFAPEGIMRREDAMLRTSRHLYVAWADAGSIV